MNLRQYRQMLEEGRFVGAEKMRNAYQYYHKLVSSNKEKGSIVQKVANLFDIPSKKLADYIKRTDGVVQSGITALMQDEDTETES